jgi:hypothetical protein
MAEHLGKDCMLEYGMEPLIAHTLMVTNAAIINTGWKQHQQLAGMLFQELEQKL